MFIIKIGGLRKKLQHIINVKFLIFSVFNPKQSIKTMLKFYEVMHEHKNDDAIDIYSSKINSKQINYDDVSPD